jgi:hypothetical protein
MTPKTLPDLRALAAADDAAFAAIRAACRALPVSHAVRPIHHGLCDAGEHLQKRIPALLDRIEALEAQDVMRANDYAALLALHNEQKAHTERAERERDALRAFLYDEKCNLNSGPFDPTALRFRITRELTKAPTHD